MGLCVRDRALNHRPRHDGIGAEVAHCSSDAHLESPGSHLAPRASGDLAHRGLPLEEHPETFDALDGTRIK
jgi:hypothetical protein